MSWFADAPVLLFEGLDARALLDISGRMRVTRFAAGDVICREGESGDSLFVIRSGLAQVVVQAAQGAVTVARLRRGEVVGEMSLLTGEPRSATVVANVPTEVLELDQKAFTAVLADHPTILANLSRILSRRLARKNRQDSHGRRRGEAVALVIDRATAPLAPAVIEAAKSASPRPVLATALAGSAPPDERAEVASLEDLLGGLDDRLGSGVTVLVAAGADQHDELPLLFEHMDRVLALISETGAMALAPLLGAVAERAELALLAADSKPPPRTVGGVAVARSVDLRRPDSDLAWLGRHLARTKIGLALGAGGAKGYAHVGAIQVLEEVGYTIDHVSGSSIGAVVGSWLGLGRDGRAIEGVMRTAFAPENVAEMFKVSWSGLSAGLEAHARMCRETTEGRAFSDLSIPFVAMAVDLEAREPAPIRDGLLWEALVASTALAGWFPPLVRDGRRLVDGVALVPVPTEAVAESGADITISVNLMSRDTLAAWPGRQPPEPPATRSGSRMLDTLLEVLDMAQIEASVRHAAQADVVVTPRFGPANWRDFHLADLFLEAGRCAAEQQLEALRALARPQSPSAQRRTDGRSAIHLRQPQGHPGEQGRAG